MTADAPADAVLARVRSFRALDADARRALAAAMTRVDTDAGQTLWQRGDPPAGLYVVAGGQVAIFQPHDEGREGEVARLGAGEVAGEMSLLRDTPHSSTARVHEAGTLWRLDAEAFDRALAERPALARGLLSALAERVQRQGRRRASGEDGEADRRTSVAVFDTKGYTERTFRAVNDDRYALKFFPPRLAQDTVGLADGFDAVCVFVNDTLDASVVHALAAQGVGLIALRCAGTNNVDLNACHEAGLSVVRVPAYSPRAVAEHAVALLLTLNRKIHRAYNRVRQGNFSLDGLVGFDLHGKTVGVVGTGKIGAAAAKIFLGFGCQVLAFDLRRDDGLAGREGLRYVALGELLGAADIITLHLPLTPETHHLIDAEALGHMRRGVVLINTSRGGLVDTAALIDALKSRQVGSAALDVYEEESEYFFEDFSREVITDDVLARLLTFNNVVVTSHQGFLTAEALENIATTTLESIGEYEAGRRGQELTHGICPTCDPQGS